MPEDSKDLKKPVSDSDKPAKEVAKEEKSTASNAPEASEKAVSVETTVEKTVSTASVSAPQTGGYPQMGGFADRFIAYIIDGFIVGILGVVVGFVFGFLTIIPSMLLRDLDTAGFMSLFMNMGAMGFGFLLTVLYYGYFYTKKGQTPGKSVMKLKVVRQEDLKYVSWARAAVRQTIGLWINGLFFYLGYLWYFMSEKRETWNDSIVKTYVVKTDEKGEILMNGPEKYEKKPLNTFLPWGCMSILFIVFIVAMIGTIIAAVTALTGAYTKGTPYGGNLDNQMQYDYENYENMYDVDGQGGDLNWENYYYEDDGTAPQGDVFETNPNGYMDDQGITDEEMNKQLEELYKQLDQYQAPQ